MKKPLAVRLLEAHKLLESENPLNTESGSFDDQDEVEEAYKPNTTDLLRYVSDDIKQLVNMVNTFGKKVRLDDFTENLEKLKKAVSVGEELDQDIQDKIKANNDKMTALKKEGGSQEEIDRLENENDELNGGNNTAKDMGESLRIDDKVSRKLKTLLMWITSGAKREVIDDTARELFAVIFNDAKYESLARKAIKAYGLSESRYSLVLMQGANGSWIFRGSMPVKLGWVNKDGTDLSDAEAEKVERASNPAFLAKTRVFKTKEEALKAAKELGEKPSQIIAYK